MKTQSVFWLIIAEPTPLPGFQVVIAQSVETVGLHMIKKIISLNTRVQPDGDTTQTAGKPVRACRQPEFPPNSFSFFLCPLPPPSVWLVFFCLWQPVAYGERKHRTSHVLLWPRAWRQTGSHFPAPPTLCHAHTASATVTLPFFGAVCVRWLCGCAVTKHGLQSPVCGSDFFFFLSLAQLFLRLWLL